MDGLGRLNEVASRLTRSMIAEDRHRGLVQALQEALPCEAVAVLRLEGESLRPLAVGGLVQEVLGRRFELRDHPRLGEICRSSVAVLFPEDSPLPDPFDGLIEGDDPHLTEVHSCLGVPLRIDGELVGALTADALRPGAFDALPSGYLDCLGTLTAAALRIGLLLETAELHARTRGPAAAPAGSAQEEMLGTSPSLARIRKEIQLVARTDLGVLVTGETGVGKERVADAIHASSERSGAPMVHVNCASLPSSLAESELFGHARGAFTGADRERRGRFLEADGGTIFLDEIGELPMELQPKLLRVLQEGEVVPIGEDTPRRVDVRVVAATNRDLVREIDGGRFRSDLYHRLCQFPIHVPPLRERAEDIPVLAGSFAESAMGQLGTSPVRLTPAAHEALARHDWPGNVRELKNVIARAALKAASQGSSDRVLLDSEHVIRELEGSSPRVPPAAPAERVGEAPEQASAMPLADQVERFKRSAIAASLARHEGNLAAAARELGVARSNLHVTAKRLGLR